MNKIKHIKKKVKEYDKLLTDGIIDDPISEQMILELDDMILELEGIISNELEKVTDRDGENNSELNSPNNIDINEQGDQQD